MSRNTSSNVAAGVTAASDARRPADVAAFEAYRASIERYELQYLKQVDRERQIRDSVNRDPMQSTRDRQDSGPGAPSFSR